MPEQIIPATGGFQSLDDYRYINLENIAGAAPEASVFPANFHVDYSGVIYLNQRKIGACTNHAAAEIKMRRNIRTTGVARAESPRPTYALCKINDGLPNTEGTYHNMPMKMGVKFGWASEAVAPNNTLLTYQEYIYGGDVSRIPKEVFADMAENRFPGYAQVGRFNDVSEAQLKQALLYAGQDGVKIGIKVGNEWWTDKNGNWSFAAKDLLPIRKPVNVVSGHDVTMTGWETEAGTGRMKIFFRNHWGEEWGDHGNGWMYLDEHPIVEAWIVSEIPDPLLAIVKSLPARADFKPVFTSNLKPKDASGPASTGPEVKNLQIAMKVFGFFPFNEPVTEYFGPITKGSVIQFQRTYKVASEAEIIAANGQVGPKTRSIINKLLSQK